MLKDIKYLLAYIVPVAAFLGIYYGGWWSGAAVYIAFVMIPVMESFIPGSSKNFEKEEEESRNKALFFDILLYLNIPILYGILFFYFHTLSTTILSAGELLGMTFSVGIIVGSIGINVAHELGHRTSKVEQFMSKVLLLSALYMHFFIEHNRGHHKNVATDADPASSRLGEHIYAFWLRSTTGGYIDAWKLEANRLQRLGLSALHYRNEMIWFQLIQLAYLSAIGFFFGWAVVPLALAVAVIGFLQLETVNYIEHYGLRRKDLGEGRHEKVSPHHSWNSNHELGRIFLYELTRHSDHHFKATRKYQVLRHFDESPQLPYGYPTSMLMSLIPPLWFRKMDHEVAQYMN